MKHLNFRNILLALAGTIGMSVSCTKAPVPDGGNDTENPELSVSANELLFSAFGEEKTFTVTANMDGFTAEVTAGDEKWCHVTIDGNTVKVTADKNELQEMRSTTVTVMLKAEKKRVRVEQEAAPDPENMPKVFEPMAFDQFIDSRVYKVMAEDVQVAEMCREYLCAEGVDNQAIVVYPVVDGKAVHAKGIVLSLLNQVMDGQRYSDSYTVAEGKVHGGTVAFENDVLTSYTAGIMAADDIRFICLDEKGELKLVSEKKPEMIEATAVAKTVKDASDNVYGLVKIASHYWLTSDLITTKATDGTDIPLETAFGDGTNWDNTKKVYIPSKFEGKGNLYSCAAGGWASGAFTDRISPEGYTVPSSAVVSALNAYLGKTGDGADEAQKAATKIRGIGEAGNWLDVWEEPWKTTGSSNISGLGLAALGYRFFHKLASDGDAAYEGTITDTFYMTSDALENGLKAWHVSGGTVNAMWDAWGGPAVGSMSFAVRCVSL